MADYAFGSNPPYALRLEGEHVGALRFPRLAIFTSLTSGAACAFAGPGTGNTLDRESSMTIYISQGRYTAAAIRAMTAKPPRCSPPPAVV